MPPKQAPSLYSLSKTHFWFAIASIVLLIALVWTVASDHNREWKDWQRKFVELKTEKIREELKAAGEKVDPKALEALEARLAEGEAALKERRVEVKAAEKESAKLALEIVKASAAAQDKKQFIDSYTYFYEENEAKGNRKEAADYEKKIRALEPGLAEARLRLETLEAGQEALAAKAAGFEQGTREAQRAIDELLKDKTRLERRLASTKSTIVKDVLNAPMIDFIAPSLRIQQVVVENLYDDYHFSRVQKVDRCTTCHLAVDQAGFEDAPQPFRTHPKLDLFVGSNSPHALETFGCTVCHGGNGHSVSFKDAAHEPSDPEEGAAWAKKYGWQRLAKWDAKMLPAAMTEAACAKCHQSVIEVPEAPRLNEGRRLAREVGCFNCHAVTGFEDAWKVGPDLRTARSKLTEEWMIRWLHDPKAFRPGTKMPRVFHLSNTSSAEDRERGAAAIEAIAAYLINHSESRTLASPPVAGDAQRGGTAFGEVGCLGCHSGPGLEGGTAGPELTGLGSKVTVPWLYAWLKDPKQHAPGTRMPNLRLTDQEAADLTAFLTASKSGGFDAQPVVRAKPEVLDALAMKYLMKNMRTAEASAELGRMDRAARLDFVGKQTIAHQGCFGCHTINGFENTKPIGVDLSEEGSKDIHQFDFGHVQGEHTRQSWIAAKLRDPRVFDEGKIKDYLDKLRMPNFDLSDAEIQALATFLLSLTDEYVPLEMQKRLDDREKTVDKGRRLVAQHNCQACHSMDGHEGTLRTLMADNPGDAPPILDGEGSKVQEKWLHEFLKQPTPIRPWLKTRMPTFGFTDAEAEALVRYFGSLDKAHVSYLGHPAPGSTSERLTAGRQLFSQFQCAKCHEVNPQSAAMGSSFLAPDLKLTEGRLKPDWVVEWLKDPETLQPGTMMPAFFPEGQSPVPDVLGGDYMEQIRAIRDHLYRLEGDGIMKPSQDTTPTTFQGEQPS